jgi:hypothetical protein
MMIGRRKPKYSEKTCPKTALSTTDPTCCPDANPGPHGRKPATNGLSYGTAKPRGNLYTELSAALAEFHLRSCFEESMKGNDLIYIHESGKLLTHT